MLFAEGEAAAGWASLLGSAVNVGFAVAVGWYLLSKAIPEMQRKNDEAQKEARTLYAESQRLQRLDYQAGLKEQREEFRAALGILEASATRREDRGTADAKEALDMVLKHCQQENERRDEHAAARDEAMRKELALLNETVRELTTLIEERIK